MSEQRQMVRMLDEGTVEVSLPNQLGYERIAMQCSASFAKIVGFGPERIEDLKTAVAEDDFQFAGVFELLKFVNISKREAV